MGGAPLETLQPAMSVTGLDEGEVDGIGLREVAQELPQRAQRPAKAPLREGRSSEDLVQCGNALSPPNITMLTIKPS